MRNEAELTKFRGKQILLMGLGLQGGGVGVAKFFLRQGAKLIITDLRSRRELAPSLKEIEKSKKRSDRIIYILGKHRKSDILSADLIVKGPGVKPDSPFLRIARRAGIPITSEMALFFALSPAKIIGVTGTRGKSTTAYLIWKFLKTKLKRVFLGGNIRVSVLEFLPKLKKEDWAVLELSSFQLEDLANANQLDIYRPDLHSPRRSPEIAVITNILRDHLNWHGTMESYLKAKSRIFAYQKPTDYLFINPSNKLLRKLVKKAKSRVITGRLPKELIKIVDKNLGKHYRESVALAYTVARHFRIPPPAIKKILQNFRGLEGRQEKIAGIRGVIFINDTTATIPEATVAALKRFYPLAKKAGGKIILIAGGSDKKLDFQGMARAIKKYAAAAVLLPGTATEKLKQEFRINNKVVVVNVFSMKEAVDEAYNLAVKGDYVILSPGAASFGLFLNEFDRGEKFVKAVKALRNMN